MSVNVSFYFRRCKGRKRGEGMRGKRPGTLFLLPTKTRENYPNLLESN